jgi:hypothetical protein
MSQIFFGVTSLLARLRSRVCGRTTLIASVYEPGESVPPPLTNGELAALGL